jgi:hypothetical protein
MGAVNPKDTASAPQEEVSATWRLSLLGSVRLDGPKGE